MLQVEKAARQAGADSGLNVIGYLCDETGVGEAARAVLQALHAQDFPVACTLVRSETTDKGDSSVAHLPEGHPYGINLFHVNADQVPIVYSELGPGFFAGRYNIGFWFWEVQPFPEQWLDHFRYLDEIWVGSRFVQDTLAHVAPIPVINMGLPLERRSLPPMTRPALGLPDDRFLFLFTFDVLSVFERKNPLGLIEAYRRAFGPDSQDTTLVLKVTRLDQEPRYRKQLEQAVTSVSGILIDQHMKRQELDGLFHACDAYVSLHRSEGFGMTMAEAMYLGKPVIATAYSGNMDFMNVGNSYPVDYHLVDLERDYGPYQKGALWADPDLDHAAAQMQRVFTDREEAFRKGTRAAADIRSLYSSEVVSRRIIERLTRIERNRGARALLPHPGGAGGIPLEEVWETEAVNPHLPIAWPTWPKGLVPKVVAFAQKVIRRLLRWYINPIVEQQNRFNAAVAQTLDSLWREISRLQAQLAQEEREAEPEEK